MSTSQAKLSLPNDTGAFNGRKPEKVISFTFTSYKQQIECRRTDVNFEFVPRAIYNDYNAEYQLRREGFSGEKSMSISPARISTNPGNVLDRLILHSRAKLPKTEAENVLADEKSTSPTSILSNQTSSPTSVLEEEERTVILTEAGIDILNFTYRNAILPLRKPSIPSPMERSIHHFDNNRSIFHDYNPTYRYGSVLNSINSVNKDTAIECHKVCKQVESIQKEIERKSTLRYAHKFQPSELTLRARGLSFRARGELDVRKGWAKASEFENNGIVGDISDSNFLGYHEPVSFINELGNPKEPKFTLIKPESTAKSAPESVTKQPIQELLKSDILSSADLKNTLLPSPESVNQPQFKSIHRDEADSAKLSSSNSPQNTTPKPTIENSASDLLNRTPNEYQPDTIDSAPIATLVVEITPKSAISQPEDEEWLEEQKKNLFGTWRASTSERALSEPVQQPVVEVVIEQKKNSIVREKPKTLLASTSRFEKMLKKNNEALSASQEKSANESEDTSLKSKSQTLSDVKTTIEPLESKKTGDMSPAVNDLNVKSKSTGTPTKNIISQNSPSRGSQDVLKPSSPATSFQEEVKSKSPSRVSQELLKTTSPAIPTQDVPNPISPAIPSQEALKSNSPSRASQELLRENSPVVKNQDTVTLMSPAQESVKSNSPARPTQEVETPGLTATSAQELVKSNSPAVTTQEVVMPGLTATSGQESVKSISPALAIQDTVNHILPAVSIAKEAAIVPPKPLSRLEKLLQLENEANETRSDALGSISNDVHVPSSTIVQSLKTEKNDNQKGTEEVSDEKKRSGSPTLVSITSAFHKPKFSSFDKREDTQKLSSEKEPDVASSMDSLRNSFLLKQVLPALPQKDSLISNAGDDSSNQSIHVSILDKLGKQNLEKSSYPATSDTIPPISLKEKVYHELQIEAIDRKISPQTNKYLNAIDLLSMQPKDQIAPEPTVGKEIESLSSKEKSENLTDDLVPETKAAEKRTAFSQAKAPSRFLNAMDAQQIQKPKSFLEDLPADTQTVQISSATAEPHNNLKVLSKSQNSISDDKESEKWLAEPVQVIWKDHKCDLKIVDFELHCYETGKTKQYKAYLPLSLRRILNVTVNDKSKSVEIQCTIPREKDKDGSEFKKITLGFNTTTIAQTWRDHIINLSFGGCFDDVIKRNIVIFTEKADKDSQKLVEKYMMEVFESSKRPTQVKCLQYNEFAIQNVLSTLEFKNLGNIVLTNPDFIPRLQQVLVRDGLCTDPIHLQSEKDPVDAALDIIRSAVGKKKLSLLQVTGLQLKREEKSVFGLFKK